jgi:hypothetical protein
VLNIVHKRKKNPPKKYRDNGSYPRDLEDNSPGALAGAAHVHVHVSHVRLLLLLQAATVPLQHNTPNNLRDPDPKLFFAGSGKIIPDPGSSGSEKWYEIKLN